jgi:hypothetical protein
MQKNAIYYFFVIVQNKTIFSSLQTYIKILKNVWGPPLPIAGYGCDVTNNS